MIYELLFPLRHDATWLRWLNVLRYVPFRDHRLDGHRDAPLVLPRALVHPRAATKADRPGRPRRRPGDPQGEERHADDGRRAHPPLRPRPHHPLVRPAERLRLGDRRGDRRLRRHRVSGRLPQDQGQELPRRPRRATSSSASFSSAAPCSATCSSRRSTCRATGGTSAPGSASRSSPFRSTRSRCRSGSTSSSPSSSSSGPRTR